MSRKRNKRVEDLTKLGSTLFTQIMKMQGLELNTNILYIFKLAREKNGTSVQVEG